MTSAPTWLATSGAPQMRARGCEWKPSSWASAVIDRRRAAAGEQLELGRRLVRPLPDRRDVEPEEEVSHRGVADDDDLEHLASVDSAALVELSQLLVDRLAQRLAKLSAHRPVVVADPVHDVAPTKALRVLERDDLDDASVVEVDELERDRGRADIDRDAVHARSARGDRVVPVVDDAVDNVHGRVDRSRARLGLGDDDAEPALAGSRS